MKRLFQLLIFFSFFSSFSVLNIPSAEWGLQMSWFLALLIFILYPFAARGKYRFPQNGNFKLITGYFFGIIGLTLIAWLLLYLKVIDTGDFEVEELMKRSKPHLIYLIFDYLVYFHIVCFLNNQEDHSKTIRVFITYTFYFITIWGFYQWLTTFDLFPYTRIFNNNASTGFTYLRFVADHRSSSVFPEPSEYAYFLGFMLSFVFVQWWYRKEKTFVYSHHPWLMMSVWLAAVAVCQSMSLFVVLPFMFLYIYSRYVRLTPMVIIGGSFGLLLLLGGIVFIEFDRISQILAGQDGSVLIRFEAFVSSYELFLSSPIVGVGFGAIRGLDLLGFLLSTTGLVGAVWFAFLIFRMKAYTDLNLVFIQGLKAMLIVTLISNPIMDHIFLWVIFAFITIPLKVADYENRMCPGTVQSE